MGLDKTITMGKVEASVKAVRAALRILEDGGLILVVDVLYLSQANPWSEKCHHCIRKIRLEPKHRDITRVLNILFSPHYINYNFSRYIDLLNRSFFGIHSVYHRRFYIECHKYKSMYKNVSDIYKNVSGFLYKSLSLT